MPLMVPRRDFFRQLQKKLEKLVYDQLIVTGDFNGVFDSKIEKSSPSKSKVNKHGILQTFAKFTNSESFKMYGV